MKFAIGYQLPDAGLGRSSIPDLVAELRPTIAEVYFAWPDVPSGRAPLPADSRPQLERDLRALRDLGVRLNLLFNASCYGPAAFSRDLADRAAEIIAHVRDLVGLDTLTTMSPLLARVARDRFPTLDVRASVNMRIGSIEALEQVADLFDSFTLAREYNRDLRRIAQVRAWCDARGKRFQLLANSGCLAFCAVQTFHDNLVSHESEIDHDDSFAAVIPGSCWQRYRRRADWTRFLRNTWIRPEDVHHYEPWVDELKLATRMHSSLRRVVRAYVDGRYAGNLADLLEPGHASLFAPWVFDNTRFPPDWFDRITSPTATDVQKDAYAAEVLDRVLVNTA